MTSKFICSWLTFVDYEDYSEHENTHFNIDFMNGVQRKYVFPGLSHIQSPVPGASHIESPVPGASHIESPVPGASHIESPVPGASHIESPVPGASHIESPVPGASHIESPVPGARHHNIESIEWSDSIVARETSTPKQQNASASIILIEDEDESPQQYQQRILKGRHKELLHKRAGLIRDKKKIEETLRNVTAELEKLIPLIN
ncbi:uncharacterized protein LOC117315074 [Pecten maximus]|uniref:uncharacterized protein LOC117315074 n=1 Tax=Pecten maximus TaxID=6579 RepID=UPI0014590FB1|nr:uncharacterized protein LOC117315074 [Pecten maximus]